MAKEICKSNGATEDISGHESLERITANELVISMDGGYYWVLKSDSPIKVTEHEDEEES